MEVVLLPFEISLEPIFLQHQVISVDGHLLNEGLVHLVVEVEHLRVPGNGCITFSRLIESFVEEQILQLGISNHLFDRFITGTSYVRVALKLKDLLVALIENYIIINLIFCSLRPLQL